MVEVKQRRNLLSRGVRSELYLAPLLILVPLFVGGTFIDIGVRNGSLQYQALGVVIVAGNLVFDYLMVVTAVRFLRQLAPTD